MKASSARESGASCSCRSTASVKPRRSAISAPRRSPTSRQRQARVITAAAISGVRGVSSSHRVSASAALVSWGSAGKSPTVSLRKEARESRVGVELRR